MTTRTPLPWQLELAKNFRDPVAMRKALGLTQEPLPGRESPPSPATPGAAPFPLRVPRGYVARMQRGNPNDPLLKQVLPVAEEDIGVPGYTRDPLNERAALHAPGVLHKYRGRVLLLTTAACAIHCRYCFRRHFSHGGEGLFDGDTGNRCLSHRHLGAALAYIRRENTIREVILSGGDPLCLPDERLAPLAKGLADIPHVQRLRIHTRLPIVLPERVDEALLAWLTRTRLHTAVVIHANHPNEIDDNVEKALLRLRTGGIAVLNQSVLLGGINDDGQTLARLNEQLFAIGTLPYYLHMPDPVVGSQRFAVREQRAKAIMTELRTRLPGYLVPQLVREVAGAKYKIPL
uniref:L-lysine 2,3-aminomutase n=1 Tax=Candidatus Kentrum sp. FM TaxID=2126340 RepID=A0A450W5Q3_9GAMM|nr:MAG: EF-P beta-lysylation protein EpmB [Candidatus Kentron sp. FM]VFJ76036.1 MAG: EF-P beta-lysylation protein EpmB [Candidatus Kentron sp. FM]VFK12383.1 MAG: EF-P beta-lysylation protein EpmB [Candidatus Kentron sp. FM]